jgi:acetyl-CoA carboxylase biotin carboxyl carrier protein
MSVEVEAPFPGTVSKILVNAGDVVNEDDELVILEAMKMQNPIVAPAGGWVKEIKVVQSEEVETGHVLLILE